MHVRKQINENAFSIPSPDYTIDLIGCGASFPSPRIAAMLYCTTTMPVTPDTELSLTFENQRVIVSPWGASLRRYFLIGDEGHATDIVWGYSGGNGKRGGQGDVLIPFSRPHQRGTVCV
ncbi:MAG: hypothetical protein QM706_15430 [Nitrospira sp.]